MSMAREWGPIFFALAVLHTFFAGWIARQIEHLRSQRLRSILHCLGEVEIAFAFWAVLYLLLLFVYDGWTDGVQSYLGGVSFFEPVFVAVILILCSMRPVLKTVAWTIESIARVVPGPRGPVLYVTALTLGPLLGSLVTEPAAMTVTAIFLLDRFLGRSKNMTFQYATLGLLLVNVSIGGVLTAYAAPPVLMVAKTWGWSSVYMATTFGWKAALACVVSAIGVSFWFRHELALLVASQNGGIEAPVHRQQFFGIDFASIRMGIFVGLFLAGLVVLGPAQVWWLKPLLAGLGQYSLFWSALGLTAVVDNAALTYLGSLVSTLDASMRYFLVAGAVTGGGLTIIANAPNPAGIAIVRDAFADGVSAWRLFLAALFPTAIAALVFLS